MKVSVHISNTWKSAFIVIKIFICLRTTHGVCVKASRKDTHFLVVRTWVEKIVDRKKKSKHKEMNKRLRKSVYTMYRKKVGSKIMKDGLYNSQLKYLSISERQSLSGLN